MNLLNGKIKPLYFKYLSAAFGSAMITSVYSIADTAMVGQYHGPDGTAALAVVAPVWTGYTNSPPQVCTTLLHFSLLLRAFQKIDKHYRTCRFFWC